MTIGVDPMPGSDTSSTTNTADNSAVALDLQGGLRYADLGRFDFETGGQLPQIRLAYETWGELNSDGSNAILIEHALTGNSHVAASDASDEPGWWEGLVGPGRPIDTEKWFVVSANMLGGCDGSTGPSSLDDDGRAWGSRFPFVTIRDAVHAEARLADALGIRVWHAVLGGSMGGARALEWAATYPDRVRGFGVFAAGAHSTAEQIAFAQAQVEAIRLDPNFHGGDYYDADHVPSGGLGIARRIAHITYRSEAELEARFGRAAQPGEDPFGSPTRRNGRYQVESYLDYKAISLAKRFDANSYLALTEALMSHDVGRNRGGEAAALSRVTATPFIAAVTSDRLYLPEQSDQLAAQLPGDVPVFMIDSPIGHDGFLTDLEQLFDELVETLSL
ncbi:homoserine O-acetyltransferase MetX [Citricoccus sp. NR2]|uniref:homoserine O-acetyltransferase MetX n=1 Tax=Citricoccus sp. NR2 TaxID=3004095 RepID=UPI0022DE0C41|nr:homoserine O-acetyltransferase [Citricoccus sp. NR2]WBL18827.1 homoserine O-acetyltransferase [Citricoccus sp. NR2]